MSGDLVPIIIIPAFFYCLAFIVKTISDNSTRKFAIKNNASDVLMEKLGSLLLTPVVANHHSSLKWGLLITSLGTGVTLADLANIDMNSLLFHGLLLLFGGGGLLLHFYLARKMLDKKDQ